MTTRGAILVVKEPRQDCFSSFNQLAQKENRGLLTSILHSRTVTRLPSPYVLARVWLGRNEPSSRSRGILEPLFADSMWGHSAYSQEQGKRKNPLFKPKVPGPSTPLPRGLPESSCAGSCSTLSEHFASRRAQRACKGWG